MAYKYIDPETIETSEIASLMKKAYEKWTKPKKRLAKDANVILEFAYLQVMRSDSGPPRSKHLAKAAVLKQEWKSTTICDFVRNI